MGKVSNRLAVCYTINKDIKLVMDGVDMKNKPIKSKSMRSRLIGIVVLCWIIPVVSLTFILSTVVTRNITAQTTQNAANTVYAAAEICMGKIDRAVASSRYASYNTTVADAYKQFRRDKDYVQLYQNIDTFLIGNYKFDSDFMFTYLCFYGEKETDELAGKGFYTLNEALFPESRSETARSAYTKFVETDLEQIIDQIHDKGTNIGFIDIGGKLYLARNLYINGSAAGAIIMRLNISDWFSTMLRTPWSHDVVLSLGGESIVVVGNDIEADEQMKKESAIDIGTAHTVRRDGRLLLFGQIENGDYSFGYLVSADEATLYNDSKFLQSVLVLSSLAVVPLLIIVLIYFNRNVNRPIANLVMGAREINEGHFGYQAEYTTTDTEFVELTDSFNEMSAQLKSQFEQIFREELALRDAKIMALQLQINPHFLGNTLEIINWEARLGNNVKVTKMIEALSTMLDAALDRNKKPMVHLSEELMYIDAYLYIVSERFGKRLEIKRDIDESLLETFVPRLILQPIVENAIEHGITPIQHGTVRINIYKEEEKLHFDIENDGQMTDEDEIKVRAALADNGPDNGLGSTHLGIRNVNERIKIIYGTESSFSIKTTKHGTVLTRIIVPFSQNNKEMQ